ncbi:colorectal mutant cancer protein isoform X1 [Lucilia cuprina]|uniref:colorectal mutant cancer protein isoform X1 n=1 Tax=Lucilia cuprina TaxID=7375 RepID=UPI001F067505|nr:colorectal mutant cancer protein isoform X1 [Lucilia cuprina]
MSNDVHLAKVSKIHRSSDIVAKGAIMNQQRGRCAGLRLAGKGVDLMDNMRPCDEEYLFGSISPRGGITHLPGDLESPDHTQRDTTESDNNISSCSTLDIVNKVDNLSLQQLETKVRELSQRLQQAEEQRTTVQQQLEECNAEKEICLRRLEIVSAAHECRITEMHCVIAELSKKLRNKQETTILEEQEPEGSEISYQEGSVYNSELNLTNPDAECQTDPLEEADYSHNEVEHNLCSEVTEELKICDTNYKAQVEALQEEILHLKAQMALLQSEIANANGHNGGISTAVEEPGSIEHYGADVEATQSLDSLEPSLQLTHKDVDDEVLNDLNNTSTLTAEDTYVTSPHKIPAIPKMAERVRLKCASKIEGDNITAMDLRNNEIKNANIVEHLVSDLKQNNSSLMESFIEPSQLDNELQRLQRKVEHLKVQNTVLSLTLDEAKEHCEHLYLLCGKYESNAIALQAALNCSDRAIEAYDVMLALLESKLGLIKEKSSAAEESRKAVESVARHLLDRLESEKNTCENSLGPWQNSFSIPDKVTPTPWTSEDDNRLRYHVSKLKGRRSTVQNTIVNLESPFSDSYEKSRLSLESKKELSGKEKATALDLEMAVLMQELLNLREENIALKVKAEQAEREKQYANDRIGVLHEALKQLQHQLQLNNETTELFHHQQQRPLHIVDQRNSTYSEAEHVALTEQQLVEALSRESELKGRIQTLIASVTESQKISDEKYEHLHNTVRELQKTNLSLTQIIEQNKRKYQTRIRKLEQKIMDITLEIGRQQQHQQLEQEVANINKYKYKQYTPSAASMQQQTTTHFNRHQHHHHQQQQQQQQQSHHDNVPETTL